MMSQKFSFSVAFLTTGALCAFGFTATVKEREMNFDEAKVRPYALEDPLVHVDGRKVTRVSWPERRRELLDVLDLSMFFRKSSRSWSLPTLEKYAADETKLPFDMHYLLAAVAPRHLLVQGFATESFDPRGEFLALEAASPAWELLVGKSLPHVAYPKLYDTSAIGPRVGYVRRGGPHGIVAVDWKWMLDFADRAFSEACGGSAPVR